MLVKRILLAVVLVLAAVIILQSQDHLNPEDYFNRKGEVYFKFNDPGRDVINQLTKIISLDNKKEGEVYAYASQNEFDSFLRFGLNYKVLPHPGDLDRVPFMVDEINIRDVTDWNFYPTYEGYVSIMEQFASDYPDICDVFSIGQSVEGRELLFARISDNVVSNEGEPQFMYTSTMHGDETAGYVLMLHLIDYLLTEYGNNDRITNMVDNLEIWINPLANPDGTYAAGNNTVNGATRFNANIVDLNRNFPDPEDGPNPDGNEWQPETVAFMELAEDNHFVLSCNIHGGEEVCNYPWDTWGHLTADNDWWVYVCREYADTAQFYSPPGYLTSFNNGITNGYAWYTISGGRQDYMTYFHQGREFTLEISSTKLLPETQLTNWWNYNYRSLLNFMEQATFGITGKVKDTASGFPVHAEIYVIGHEEDSSWVYSHLPFGNYKRFIYEGNYYLRVSASGYNTRLIPAIPVNNRQKTDLNIWLKPEGVGSISQNDISAKLQLYPNPAAGNTVMLRSETLVEHLRLYNMQGQQVIRQSVYDRKVPVEIGHLEPGTYVVEVVTEKGRGTKNLIIE